MEDDFLLDDTEDAYLDDILDLVEDDKRKTLDVVKLIQTALVSKEDLVKLLSSNKSFTTLVGEDQENWLSNIDTVLNNQNTDVSTENMLLEDLLMWGLVNRLFSKWTKKIDKMRLRLKASVDTLKDDLAGDDSDKVEEKLLNKRVKWLPPKQVGVQLQKDSLALFKTVSQATKNIRTYDMKNISKAVGNISKSSAIGSTKWGRLVGTYLGGSLLSKGGVALGTYIGSQVGGPIGATIGAGTGYVTGILAANLTSKLFIQTVEQLGYKSADDIIKFTEDQIKLLGEVSALQKDISTISGNVVKEDNVQELKDKVRVIKSTLKMNIKLINIVNRGIIETI